MSIWDLIANYVNGHMTVIVGHVIGATFLAGVYHVYQHPRVRRVFTKR